MSIAMTCSSLDLGGALPVHSVGDVERDWTKVVHHCDPGACGRLHAASLALGTAHHAASTSVVDT